MKKGGAQRDAKATSPFPVLLANDSSIHAIGIEPAGAIPSSINNIEHLRRSAGDTQRILVDIVGSLPRWGDIKGTHSRTHNSALDTLQSHRAGMLGFGCHDGCRRAQVGLVFN